MTLNQFKGILFSLSGVLLHTIIQVSYQGWLPDFQAWLYRAKWNSFKTHLHTREAWNLIEYLGHAVLKFYVLLLQAQLATGNDATFDFPKNMSRSLEDDFLVVVEICFF